MKHSNFNAALCSHNLHQHCQELSLIWRNLHLTARQCGSLLSQLLENLGLSNSRNQLWFPRMLQDVLVQLVGDVSRVLPNLFIVYGRDEYCCRRVV
jgi:hypothetical protein